MDVCLVNMPFTVLERPSLALGILKGALTQEGIDCRCLYANLEFAEKVGLFPYRLAGRQDCWVGDWIFARSAFKGFDPDPVSYVNLFWEQVKDSLPALDNQTVTEALFDLRERAEDFILYLAGEISREKPAVIGLSSTFQCQTASLALLRRLKEIDPGLVTMLGGANCETVMGLSLHKHFPWLDFVVSGEADLIFAPLVKSILAKGPDLQSDELPQGVLGPAHRKNHYQGLEPDQVRAMISDWGAKDTKRPIPDYDDYFTQLEKCEFLNECVSPGLLVEASRGCYNATKKPCLFCSLNGPANHYRVRPAKEVIREMQHLSARYQVDRFILADNILAPNHLKTLFPALPAELPGKNIFCELSPSLSKRQLSILAQAGVVVAQPGMESLSSEALKILNKGLSGINNIRFLKNCLELGISLIWMILYNYPGEKDAWHEVTADIIPLLHHLQPPLYLNQVQLSRFSTLEQKAPRFGLSLKPKEIFKWIYPLGEKELADLVWDFEDREFAERPRGQKGLKRLKEAVLLWNRLFRSKEPPRLVYKDQNGVLEITDTRPTTLGSKYALTGLLREICLACDQGLGLKRLVGNGLAEKWGEQEIENSLEKLKHAGLVLVMDQKALFLALPKPRRSLLPDRLFPAGSIDKNLYYALKATQYRPGAHFVQGEKR
ncbi:hypothetical protein X474_08780 [Dethiosulfatarculus sandiegensis]|uniref:Uncharacterized protein n=1 Tax=Dethiosulfatarculus sandiegensis TaxID=1429043 RepID=A0A0D2J832_9BACT|nr:hypothetical protein X474_08780 [Dethiosulfatarculus sandiegensis]